MTRRVIPYSQEELDFVKANCQLLTAEQFRLFQERFDRPDVTQKNLNSLRKRKRWLTGRNGQYITGNTPHPNSGMKTANATSFKKGVKPHNWLPVGSTRTNKDGYQEEKVAEPKEWRQSHTLLWEASHGPVPAGYCVTFIDGDKAKLEIENLELITRNANLQINRLRCSSMPIELQPTVRLLGKLCAKSIERKEAAA